jgi:hypothetical protein
MEPGLHGIGVERIVYEGTSFKSRWLPPWANENESKGEESKGSGQPDRTRSNRTRFYGTLLRSFKLKRMLLLSILAITRNFGRYFGLTADGAFYKYPFAHPEVTNSTITPSVDTVLFGPVLHANLYSKTSGFVRALLGGEHVGGTNQTPNISFAGGVGGGLDYQLKPRISLRASGDVILQSFSVTGNSAALGYSPHETRNGRATVGVVYHF